MGRTGPAACKKRKFHERQSSRPRQREERVRRRQKSEVDLSPVLFYITYITPEAPEGREGGLAELARAGSNRNELGSNTHDGADGRMGAKRAEMSECRGG